MPDSIRDQPPARDNARAGHGGDPIERMLRHVLAETPSSHGEAACIDGETLAAWADGRLPAAERGHIERHLADCVRCQSMTAAFARMRPDTPRAEPRFHWRLRWLVPLATAATAAGLWLAVPGRVPIDSNQQNAVDMAASRAEVAEADRQSQQPAPAAAPPPAEPAAPAPPSSVAAGARPRIARDDAAGEGPSFDRRQESSLQDRSAGSLDRGTAPPAAVAERDKAEPEAARRRAFNAASPPPIEIAAANGASRWRITNGQQVEWSPSGGADWEPATIAGPGALTAGSAPSAAVCWLVGERGAVFVATDGRTFIRVPFPEAVDLVSVTAADDRTASITAVDGRMWRTNDAGATWAPGR